MKQKAIIVDLDGTLSNTRHRKHFVEQEEKDWKSFYAGITEDLPHEWCLELIKGMKSQGIQILFVSGRPSDYRKATEMWLTFHAPEYEGLFMRAKGDMRLDSIIKAEIYKNEIEPNYEILFCVDDRQQVVDAWRELGLTCLQCDKGNF